MTVNSSITIDVILCMGTNLCICVDVDIAADTGYITGAVDVVIAIVVEVAVIRVGLGCKCYQSVELAWFCYLGLLGDVVRRRSG